MLAYISVRCGSRPRHLRPQVQTLGAACYYPAGPRVLQECGCSAADQPHILDIFARSGQRSADLARHLEHPTVSSLGSAGP